MNYSLLVGVHFYNVFCSPPRLVYLLVDANVHIGFNALIYSTQPGSFPIAGVLFAVNPKGVH